MTPLYSTGKCMTTTYTAFDYMPAQHYTRYAPPLIAQRAESN